MSLVAVEGGAEDREETVEDLEGLAPRTKLTHTEPHQVQGRAMKTKHLCSKCVFVSFFSSKARNQDIYVMESHVLIHYHTVISFCLWPFVNAFFGAVSSL